MHRTREQDGDSLPRKPDGVEVAIKIMQANDEEELRGRRREFDILSTLLGDSNVQADFAFLYAFGHTMHLYNAFQCILYVATGKVVDTSEEPPLAALAIQCCWYVRLLALVSDATF